MGTSEPLPTTPESEKDKDKDALIYEEKICMEYKELMKTLPKGNGWKVEYLYNYNGFWLDPSFIKTNLFLHTYFRSQPSDIFLAFFMKSGTTWLKALMFSIINRHRYSISDHPLLRQNPQMSFPCIDVGIYPSVDFNNFPTPRLFATHLPQTLLPSCITSCKFVYVCRDPKDVFISKWYFMDKIRSKDLGPLSLDEAFELFCQGVSDFGPFWEHVLSYWRANLDSPDQILFLKYEELKKRPEVELRKLAVFMRQPFTIEEEERGVVEEIVKLCSFENLSNLEVNKKGVSAFKKERVENRIFFRKGEIGDWKNHLSDEMKDRIDKITYEKLKGSGLILGLEV